ncbi:hypothetical protein FQR65_LT18428 [Abscondita terminalis]|nr:hypothetical protein FQR65_LT18428 [Abscondita terminalis]
MKIIHKSVLLLKSENNEDKYDAALTDNGFLVKHIRTLEFRYINLEQLHSKIRSPDDYDGIIFTTPRSVKALKEALANDILDPKWSGLNLECRGKESGNAKNLSSVILNGDKNKLLVQKYIKYF